MANFIRNAGKSNEYLAVKLPIYKLKSPFSTELHREEDINARETPRKEVENDLIPWLNKTSHEIKHIFNQSKETRDFYKH